MLCYCGQRLIDYDMNGNRLNGDFYSPDKPGSMELTADVYIDRGVAEVVFDGGAVLNINEARCEKLLDLRLRLPRQPAARENTRSVHPHSIW